MKKKQRRYITTFTDFEKRVYQAVLKIPEGEVRSYKWVARMAGSPIACRAVGNALNKNPCPGRIPCHRVIKSDGGIGGFSKGVKAKKRLLAKERFLSTKVRAQEPFLKA